MSSITATTTNPVEISSFYSHLSMMPLVGHGPKLPSNIYRPNSSSLWMDPAIQPFFYYNLALNDPNHKRKNATRETTATLKAWLYEHRKNPYPTKNEKMVLAMVTKMTLTQVSTWFANARRRLKKENKLHRITNNNRTTGGKSEEDDEDDDDEEEEDDETRYSSKESDVDIEEGDEQQQQSIKINTHDNHLLYNENKSKNTNAAVVVVSNLKRKCDDHNEDLAQPPAKIIAGNRPKIWSLVDVVQSNETTNRSSHAITTPSIHYPLPSPARLVVPPLYPFVTPSPYLLYPPPNSCLPTCLTSPSHSEHSTNSSSSSSSSSSPSSSSTTSCCSSTQTK